MMDMPIMMPIICTVSFTARLLLGRWGQESSSGTISTSEMYKNVPATHALSHACCIVPRNIPRAMPTQQINDATMFQ